VHSLPPGMWRTSRWLRLYDWDWKQHPFPGLTQAAIDYRATTYPRRFFYHVLRVCSTGDDRADGVEYSAGVHDLLAACFEPTSFDDLVAGEVGRRHGADAVSGAVADLIERGFVVPVDADEPVDTAAVAAASELYAAIQVRQEFAAALDVVKEVEPRTVLEVGTAFGGTLFGWAQVAHPDARLVSVDLPGGIGGGGYMPEHESHFRNFCGAGQQLSCVLGASQLPDTIERVRAALDGAAVDMMLIDGDHSYEGVSRDFANYRSLAREGGLILFHDIQPPPPKTEQPMGVWRFWREIREDYRHLEIVHDPTQFSAGIGVLYV
jgi:predicted O-methyltransferase YrrM